MPEARFKPNEHSYYSEDLNYAFNEDIGLKNFLGIACKIIFPHRSLMAMNEYTNNWNALAEVWDLFEQNGLNNDLLSELFKSHQPSPPIALIGSGRGTILSLLNDIFNRNNICGFDSSEEMIKISQSRGISNVKLSHDLVDPLKTADTFKSIIVTTGVIDGLDIESIAILIDNLTEHLNSNGKIICTIFSNDSKQYDTAKLYGLVDHEGIKITGLYEYAFEYFYNKSDIKITGDRRTIIEQKVGLINRYRIIKELAKRKSITIEEALGFIQMNLSSIRKIIKYDDFINLIKQKKLKILYQHNSYYENVRLFVLTL